MFGATHNPRATSNCAGQDRRKDQRASPARECHRVGKGGDTQEQKADDASAQDFRFLLKLTEPHRDWAFDKPGEGGNG
jgi:hypothetical protein